MPTPFNHIVLGQELLDDDRLPKPLLARLQRSRPAFLLGNTAPDFGALVGKPRRETHYFQVPLQETSPAHNRLLAAHPHLGQPEQLSDDQAAFIAGYLAHLWLDQAWISAVFEPYFGPQVSRGSFRERLVEHNLLRAYLDLQERDRIPDDLGSTLRAARPRGWLPFAADAELRQWRDHLAAQVEPGGKIRTVEVFAQRLKMPRRKFARRLQSPEEMERSVFAHLPRRQLTSFWERRFSYTRELVRYYLEGDLEAAPRVNQPLERQAPSPTRPIFEGRR